MFKTVRKELHTIAAALDPRWNWRGFRTVENPIHESDNRLPDNVRNFMRNLGAVAGGTHVIYGGALNDLATGRTPKDFDGYLLGHLHPLLTMRRVERWSDANGYEVEHYRRRVRLLWKRLKIKTEHGEYDIGCLQGSISAEQFARQMADEADVSPCARSATADRAFVSQRCLEGEASGHLIFRRFKMDRDRFRHLNRFHKYGIVKYPDRPISYQDPADAVLFAPLHEQRATIAIAHAELCRSGPAPTDIEPFRPLVANLYDALHARAQAQLT